MTALAQLILVLALGLTSTARGVWPLQPRPAVVNGFRPPASAWGPGHRGVDLLGHRGQPVHAALAGTVTFAGSLAGRGVVVVNHGEIRTTYEPVRARAQRGDRVATGEVIGTLQAFSSHCWPRACLHWGLLRGETYLDPLILVGAGPVRLLPLGPPAGPGPLLGPLSRGAPLPSGVAPRSVRRTSVARRPIGLTEVAPPAIAPPGTRPLEQPANGSRYVRPATLWR